MATRSTAGKLQALIDEVSDLEAMAGNVQVEDEGAGSVVAERLAAAYRRWLSACLEALPEDLKGKFRNEYEGGAFTFKIKHFLQDPIMKNPLYAEDLDELTKKLLSPWQYPVKDRFINPLRQQHNYLEEARMRLGTSSAAADALHLLEQVGRRLSITLSILEAGHRDRPGISIDDEYDLQYILHAIAVLHFEEVEPEEPTPKMAGASSRLDFLLKQERVAIETKMMRPSLSKNKLREELASDIVYFRAHPDVDALFILVYDPKRKRTNAAGFENALNSESDDFVVRIVIVS